MYTCNILFPTQNHQFIYCKLQPETQKSRLSLTLIQRKKTKIISTPPFPHQSDQQMEPPEELEGALRSQHSADQTLMKPRIQC